jgi:P-type conjugative transfer ATPase TrbB
LAENEHSQRLDVKLRRELGARVLELLEDESTEDILLNPNGDLWVNRRGAGFVRIGQMNASQALSAMGTIAAIRGTVLNHQSPILETELPVDGERFEGLVPPVVVSPAFAIRLRPRRVYTIDDYEIAGILTSRDDPRNQTIRRSTFSESVRGLDHAEIIRRAICARKNILIAGSTGAGKSTLLNAILDGISRLTPNDRVVLIEDTIELKCSATNYVALHAAGDISMLTCLRACMRLKPNRIVVGEVRGAEALALLKAWNTGHPGGCCTVHANDAVAALSRLEQLIAEATPAPQQKLIAEAVDVVIFVDEEPDLPAGRKVREVLLVTDYSDGKYQYERV